MPPVRPTACPLARRSENASSYSAPTATGALRAVSLFVKRLEQVIGLVDQLLDTLARRIDGATAHHDAHDGKRERGAETRDADPHQRAREVRLAALVGSIVVGLLVHRFSKVRAAER